MTDALERYTAAVNALDALPRQVADARRSAESEHDRAQRHIEESVRSATAASDSLRHRVQELLDDARSILAKVELSDQLPRKLRPGSHGAEIAAVEADLAALAAAVAAVERHRAEARARRLTEAQDRERALEEEALSAARREAALRKQQERARLEAHRARARRAAMAVAAFGLAASGAAAVASLPLGAVVLVLGAIASWITAARVGPEPPTSTEG